MSLQNFRPIPALQDPTIDRFNAVVMEVRGCDVMLDESFFYPNISAQPCDTGIAVWENHTCAINRVEFRAGQLWHQFAPPVPLVGTPVHCQIHWSRRNLMSRLHTAAVLIAGVAHKLWACDISSCSLSPSAIRLDFTCLPKTALEIEELLARCNHAITEGANVSTRWIAVHRAAEHVSLYRSVATSRKVQQVPGRVVQIGVNGHTLERQFDIGTHVQNIRELLVIRLGSGDDSGKKAFENKGRNHFRIRFHLPDI